MAIAYNVCLILGIIMLFVSSQFYYIHALDSNTSLSSPSASPLFINLSASNNNNNNHYNNIKQSPYEPYDERLAFDLIQYSSAAYIARNIPSMVEYPNALCEATFSKFELCSTLENKKSTYGLIGTDHEKKSYYNCF